MGRKDFTIKAFVIILLLVITIVTMLPFFWMILTSFKTSAEAVKIPLKWFPDNYKLDNFETIFEKYDFARYYLNTVLVTVGIVVPQVYLSALAAYAFARLDFPGKNVIFVSLMVALMVPLQMIILPRYVMMIEFGWIDKLTGIIVPGIASIYATFFIRQTMMGIPRELDESAYLDGCSYFRIFYSIILPLCTSTLVAMGIMAVTFAWNDLLWPIMVLNSLSKYTLPIGVANLRGQFNTPFNLLMAAATASTLPIVAIFLIGQRYFLEGISTSGIKA